MRLIISFYVHCLSCPNFMSLYLKVLQVWRILKMLRILISYLLINSALAANDDDCQVGDITFTGFDIEKVRDAAVHHFQDSLKRNTTHTYTYVCVCVKRPYQTAKKTSHNAQET